MSERIKGVIAAPIRECFGFDCPDEWVATRIIAALKAARIAVVELPEPSYADDPEGNLEPGGKGFNSADPRLSEHGVYAFNGRVFDQYDGWSPAEARTIASWWLAAADAAEAAR